MQKARKTYKATESELEELGEVQDAAAGLMKQYLFPAVRAMRAKILKETGKFRIGDLSFQFPYIQGAVLSVYAGTTGCSLDFEHPSFLSKNHCADRKPYLWLLL